MTLNALLSTREVQELLGKNNPQSIHRLVHDDGLPAIRVGRTFRFDPDAVAQWLRERTVNS